MSVSFNSLQKKGEVRMGKAEKRKKIVEDRPSEGLLCEKVLYYVFDKTCVSSVAMMEG